MALAELLLNYCSLKLLIGTQLSAARLIVWWRMKRKHRWLALFFRAQILHTDPFPFFAAFGGHGFGDVFCWPNEL